MKVGLSLTKHSERRLICFKVLDAGSKSISDHEVLLFIQSQQAAHAKEPQTFPQPANYVRALERHQAHLAHEERSFLNNPKYDDDSGYVIKLMEALEPSVQLTKTELLMLINHRPYKRELLLPMIEDIETRYSEEQQELIVNKVVEVLGHPGENTDVQETSAQDDTEMAEG